MPLREVGRATANPGAQAGGLEHRRHGIPVEVTGRVQLTRWTADPSDPSDPSKQLGVRQSCELVSGQAVKDFMAKYPYTASPEPNGA